MILGRSRKLTKKATADVGPVYEAAALFVREGLESDGSLFSPGQPVWTEAAAVDLERRFVQNPDTSDDSFEEKFHRQLAGAPSTTIRLAAELLFVHFLISMQLRGETKRRMINAVASWAPEPVLLPPALVSATEAGIANAGRSFLQHRPFLLMYLVEFVIRWKRLPVEDRRTLLNDPWRFKEFVFAIPARAARLQQHALLHLVHPDTFESIVSEPHKEQIAARFALPAEASETDLDRRLLLVRERLASDYGRDFTYYQDDVKSLWQPVDDPKPPVVEAERGTRFWVEKSLVAERSDRRSGPHALGEALWSPQTSEDGRDIYRLMREVAPGDIVLHFVDNRHFSGISRVTAAPDDSFRGVTGTAWGDRPCLRISLGSYTPLDPPIEREQLFNDLPTRARLQEILSAHRGLFFNRNFELNQGSYLTAAPISLVKVLNDIHKGRTGSDLPLVPLENILPETEEVQEPFRRPLSLEWLADQTLWSQERLLEIVEVLRSKAPHVVLAGPPGTGKTWIAQLLARYVTGDDPKRHSIVQFHPSYSYEAFIEGLRPVMKGNAIAFDRVPGVVLQLEERHRGDDRPFVLVVDEMNRANLPRVFGELMFLLEYRDRAIDLQFTKDFRLPPTFSLIGTMNTADRSIRSIDVALRRRFEFFECPPDAGVLERYFSSRQNGVPSLIDGFVALNRELTTHLDRHHTIGHTFFMMNDMTPDALFAAWRRKIQPLIDDYFFDQPDIAQSFEAARFWPELQG